MALATVTAGPGLGAKLLVRPGGESLGTLGDPDLDRVVARDALGELEAGLTSTRHYGEHGEAREDDRVGVHRVVRAAAADDHLRRGRLHRRAGQRGQGARLPRDRVRRARGVRHPAALPDGRRGRERLARTATSRRSATTSGRATRSACSPTTPSSTFPPSSARSPPASAISARWGRARRTATRIERLREAGVDRRRARPHPWRPSASTSGPARRRRPQCRSAPRSSELAPAASAPPCATARDRSTR